MNSGGNWRDVVRRERDRFAEIAAPMVAEALVVILFILLETAIIGVMEWATGLRSPKIRAFVEPVFDALYIASAIGVIIYYAIYFVTEVVNKLRRSSGGS